MRSTDRLRLSEFSAVSGPPPNNNHIVSSSEYTLTTHNWRTSEEEVKSSFVIVIIISSSSCKIHRPSVPAVLILHPLPSKLSQSDGRDFRMLEDTSYPLISPLVTFSCSPPACRHDHGRSRDSGSDGTTIQHRRRSLDFPASLFLTSQNGARGRVGPVCLLPDWTDGPL